MVGFHEGRGFHSNNFKTLTFFWFYYLCAHHYVLFPHPVYLIPPFLHSLYNHFPVSLHSPSLPPSASYFLNLCPAPLPLSLLLSVPLHFLFSLSFLSFPSPFSILYFFSFHLPAAQIVIRVFL